MRLTERTDYALRVLMLLASSERKWPVPRMAQALGVSSNHLAKVVQAMHDRGWVETSRGRGGGVRLAIRPGALRLGDVVRAMEPDLALVACFREDGSCPLAPACGLAGALRAARDAFLGEMDTRTIEDLIRRRKRELVRIAVQSTGE